MSVITTGVNPKLLWEGLNAVWGSVQGKYNEYPMEWKDLFDEAGSSKAYEEDVQLIGFGLAPQKSEGGSVSYDTMAQGFVSRYTNVSYGLGFIITREEMDDNLYISRGQQRTEALAFSMRQTKEIVAANVYNRATDSSYTGGDGKELLATDHPSNAGDWSNELNPSADLSEASLEDLCIQIAQATDDRGLTIALRPAKLIVPPELEFEACRILDSELQNDSANNAVNALRAKGKIPQIAVNHYLTDADQFFIRTTAQNGMKMFERTALDFSQDGDFDTDNAKFKAYERYAFGWSDPRGVYGSSGA